MSSHGAKSTKKPLSFIRFDLFASPDCFTASFCEMIIVTVGTFPSLCFFVFIGKTNVALRKCHRDNRDKSMVSVLASLP